MKILLTFGILAILTLHTHAVDNNPVALGASDTKKMIEMISSTNNNNTNNNDPEQSFYQSKKTKIALPTGTVKTTKDNGNKEFQDAINDAFNAFQQEHIEVALVFYKKAHELDDKNIDAMFGAGVCYQILGQTEDATQMYSKLLKVDPNYFPAKNNIVILISGKSTEAAIKELKSLVSQNENNSFLLAQIGTLYSNSEKYNDALYYLSLAIEKEPSNPTYLYNMAITLDYMKRYKDAYSYYEHTLARMQYSSLLDRNVIEARMKYIKQCLGGNKK